MIYRVIKNLYCMFASFYIRLEDRLVKAELRVPIGKVSQVAAQGVEVSSIGHLDLDGFAAQFSTDVAELFSERLDNCYGFKVTMDGVITGYLWASSCRQGADRHVAFKYEVNPGPGNIYMFDCWLDDRPDTVQTAKILLKHALGTCKTMGFRTAFFSYDAGHLNLQKAVQACGFLPVGTLQYWRLFGFSRRDVRALAIVER